MLFEKRIRGRAAVLALGMKPGERFKSDLTTRWYQFCFCDIVSMLRMSIHGVRMFTEPVFYRGRHGQESEEGKEDRQGSRQEGGKEDFKEKEVVVPATERLPPAGRNPDAKRTCPKDLKCPLQPFGNAARQHKTGPLCS